MKVGILTYHHTTNYGATLQAYALWKTIKQYGHEVEIIDYRPYKAAIIYFKKLLPLLGTKGNYFKYKWNKHSIPYIIQAWRMRRFLSKMDLSNKTYVRGGLKKIGDRYDVVICGSDQIWNIKSKFRGGLDTSFFLDFVNNETTKKVSYAPSFGQIRSLDSDKHLIFQLISEFERISVRDDNSLNIIEQECNRAATKVLDPTFLNDFSEFKSTPKLDRGYIILYSVTNFTTEEQKQIKSLIESITKIKNLLVVSLGKPNKLADLNLITIDPEEWVGYFKNASYVITNSYHGTIFSLKFKRMFTVLTRPDNIKIKDLLRSLDLESRIIDRQESSLFSQQSAEINYEPVHEILAEKIAASKNYLVEALDAEKLEATVKQA